MAELNLITIIEEYVLIRRPLKRKCHDIFRLRFFVEQVLLVPLDMPREDFYFYRTFVVLFVFLIDSPVYSLSGS
jgi:hypothetical protein